MRAMEIAEGNMWAKKTTAVGDTVLGEIQSYLDSREQWTDSNKMMSE